MPSNPPPSGAPVEPVESFELILPDDPRPGNDWYLWAGVVALLVFVVFFPAINGQFLWDDDHHVGLIPTVQTLSGLAEIWTPLKATPQYYPLTFTSFWLEYRIWKENTLGYHLDNLLLHAGAAVLVWRLLRRLRLPGAWVAAAIWAIHPLQAESVCWMSERKNVLSGLLFFASIWFYLEYAEFTPRPKRPRPGLSADGSTFLLGNRGLAYAASWVLFVLALLAKSVACAMPVVMLILLWWQKRRIFNRKTLLPLIPFFAAGVAMAVVTVHLEISPSGNVAAEGPDWAISPVQRLLIAGRGVWFYVVKLIWPVGLTFSYPRILPSVESMGGMLYALQWGYVIAAVGLVAVLWGMRNRWGRGPLAAVLYYGIVIFPALGFINIYPMRYSFVADHFQYLAGLGLIVLAVAAAGSAIRRWAVPAPVATGIAAVVLASLAVPAWLQAHIYDSQVALWRDTLAKNPDSWMAQHNLGTQLIKLGQQAQKDAADSTSQGDPDTAGQDTQTATDDFQEAEQLFRRSLELHPASYATHTSLGFLYSLMGRFPQAEFEMRTAAEMDEQEQVAHQLIAPYVFYAKLLERDHPEVDVRPWLDRAMALTVRPRTEPAEAADVHLTYGDYWLKHSDIARRAGKSTEELTDLKQATSELNTGLEKMPTNVAGLINLALANQRMGVIDQQRADAARSAGRLDEADYYVNQSVEVDDRGALECYLKAAAQYPSERFAPAMIGIGELSVRHIVDRDLQGDFVHDLLVGMQFFKQAIEVDPRISAAKDNLAAINRQLMQEGATDEAHEATWTPLQQKVQALMGADVSPAAASAADAAAHDALWPLLRTDPLFQPLIDLRLAIRAYLRENTAAAAARNLHDAADKLLGDLNQRNPAHGRANDAIAAATCFEGAVTADERSAAAWLTLRATADVLAMAIADHNDTPGLKDALTRAQSVLDQRRAATQPTTQSAEQPATEPGGNR